MIFFFSQLQYEVWYIQWCKIWCRDFKKMVKYSVWVSMYQGDPQHLYFSLTPLPSLPLSLHWPWPTRKKGSFLPFQVSLWGNLGIIVVRIYPENPANPFFHLDVPELMPKLLSHRGSAAPWLCSVTFFSLPFTYSAPLKLLCALGFLGLQLTLDN